MEKTVIIDSRPIRFKATAAFLKRYKAQFRRDPFADLFKALDAFGGEQINLAACDLEIFYDIAWTFAKTANREIPEPMTWLDEFGEFPLVEVMPQIIDLMAATVGTTVEAKNGTAAARLAK